MRLVSDRRFWLALAAIALIGAFRYAGADDVLSLATLRENREVLTRLVESQFALAVLAYLAIYVFTVAFSIPGAAVLTLAGGFLFGAVWGTLLTVIAATAGATLVFLFARFIFGDNTLQTFGPQAERLAANIRKNAWSYLLVLRLVPLFPFFLVNLTPAFAGVGLLAYVLTTFFGIIPGTAVFATAGAGIGTILDQGEDISAATVLTPEILAALTGLALLSLAAIPLRRRFAERGASSNGQDRKQIRAAGQ